jgi:hypothetical protein
MNPFIDKGVYPSIRKLYSYQVFKHLVLEFDCYFNGFVKPDKKELIHVVKTIKAFEDLVGTYPSYDSIATFMGSSFTNHSRLIRPISLREILQSSTLLMLLKYEFITLPYTRGEDMVKNCDLFEVGDLPSVVGVPDNVDDLIVYNTYVEMVNNPKPGIREEIISNILKNITKIALDAYNRSGSNGGYLEDKYVKYISTDGDEDDLYLLGSLVTLGKAYGVITDNDENDIALSIPIRAYCLCISEVEVTIKGDIDEANLRWSTDWNVTKSNMGTVLSEIMKCTDVRKIYDWLPVLT